MKIVPTIYSLLIGALAAVLLTSCKPNAPTDNSKPADVDYYTCSMHPSVHSQDPHGKCPICSMDLIPVLKKGAPATNSPATNSGSPSAEFTIPLQRQQQIGVTYATIEKRRFTNTLRAVGTVALDQQRHWRYAARAESFVNELFVFSRGEPVEKDAPLLTLYSPDLLTAQIEFTNLLKIRDLAIIKKSSGPSNDVEVARQRLRLWNLTDAQLADLERSRKPSGALTLRSPFKGVVQNLDINQGRRVMPGDPLVDIADLSVVWVWVQFYQDELPLLKPGQPITVTTSSYPGEKFNGHISVIDPFLNDALRTGRVRVDVENSAFKLHPDMYVDTELTVESTEGVAIPAPAVMPTGQHNLVFLDKGEGRLEPRFIELGRKHGDFYEVLSGITVADRVVSSANFLIDAEAKVQGALKSW